MTRWHTPDCTAPDIVVASPPGPPSCRTCGSTPNLADIIRQQAHESPFPAPPPDEPRGQMNLWWPRSVPYLNTPPKPLPTLNQRDSDCPPSTAPPPDIPVPSRQPERSPIYPTPLQPGEIRLACLVGTSSSSPDDPVHLTLETYPLSNCPPYETVSYCWAGEDRDDTRCRPVYVGPYWDVMLHTRNCWELLRFVRPARGVRVVWVDAVCIDQGCDAERAAQVAQMGRIYTLCTQVVVYLGPEVAPLLPEGQYPRRARLQDFGKREGGADGVGDASGVSELLQKRYFSRLWVVQELILSPRVVIRIGDVDFQSDGATSGRLWGTQIGDLGLAPWVRHTSRGAPLDMDFLQVMRLTFSSACADPRDRVFGVMGIISTDSQRLEPDYSLSVQHVFVGLFAHMVIVLNRRRLLLLASGVSGSAPSVPSWVPDWTTWNRWQGVFEPRKTPSLSQLHRTVEDFRALLTDRCPRGGHLVSPILPLRYRRESSLSQEPAFGVNPTTAALTAKMVRLLRLGAMPELVGYLRHDELPLFEVRCGNHLIYLTCKHRLDIVVEPGHDDLYLFAIDDEDRVPGLCILRRTARSSGNTVRLLAACETVFLRFAADPADARPDMALYFPFGRLFTKLRRPWPNEQLDDIDTEPLFIGDLYWTLSEVLEWAQAWLDAPLNPDEQLLFLPQSNSKRRDILPIYLALIQKDTDDALDASKRLKGLDDVFDTYKQYVVENYGKELTHARFIFTVPFNVFNTLYFDKEHRRNRFQLDWEQAVEDPWSKFQPIQTPETRSEVASQCPATATIAVKDETVRRTLLALSASRFFYMIRAAARRTGESVEQLLSRNTTEADCLVRVPIDIWTERLMDEFGCDGSIEFVSIV